MNELLGGRIKELRTIHEMTQEQLADVLGISRQKLARIENGNNNVSLDILMKIADALDVTVNDITKVLNEQPSVVFRNNEGHSSADEIFAMLDLFYANKHIYQRLQPDEE